MKNFIQDGNVLTLTAPYDRTAGQGALVGSLFGIAATDVLSGAVGEFAVVGVFSHAKTASQAWTAGAKIYWDNTNKVMTNVATSNTHVGHAVEAVAGGASDTIGKVRLHGVSSGATF
jgi:predicted RecA/RadA family phage recombinase